ncbi:K+/H+ antiporter [Sphaerisporangium siamense]|uniref:Cell volume regulation protein A n=1 Tax=Sphaerisporangium siamense TaxID=795645 RepID=A0A7W7G8U3_9ACTN|nr:potassium/proton antiporter [Sphaerisporangium siamense]MBB4700672.1 cell volume regulation protein A [Sphaerisporangium siamense]GII89559.1 K+/H+ antiporter [Sphaerisporangium siamense]
MNLNIWLLLASVVVIAAIASVRIAHRTGLPTLLIYLGIGLLLGEAGLGVQFENAGLAQQIGLAALAVILAEGGLTTQWTHVRQGVPTALALATIGVGVSIIVLAGSVHWLLGMDWRMALLLGAILASTDAAAVFSVLRRLPLPRRLAGILEAESGFNDAPTVIVVVMLSRLGTPLPDLAHVMGEAALELGVGAAVGLAVGPLGGYALRRVALPSSGLYPIAVLALAFVAYSGAALLHGSGFLSVYLATLVLGNTRLPHRPATRGFAEGAAWLAQIGLFVMLGILASPSELPTTIVPGLIAGLALLLLARPASVVASALIVRVAGVDSLSWRDQLFLSWAGLRGAVPIVLATIPWAAGIIGAKGLFNEVFVIVIVFTMVQGPTLPYLARVLGIGAPGEARDLGVEAAPLEELDADLLQVTIPPGSGLHGVEIFELRLPSDAAVTMVVREGRSFVPELSTRLRAEDQLLVVTTAACRQTVERRLRAVSRRGKLAGWYGERGD